MLITASKSTDEKGRVAELYENKVQTQMEAAHMHAASIWTISGYTLGHRAGRAGFALVMQIERAGHCWDRSAGRARPGRNHCSRDESVDVSQRTNRKELESGKRWGTDWDFAGLGRFGGTSGTQMSACSWA